MLLALLWPAGEAVASPFVDVSLPESLPIRRKLLLAATLEGAGTRRHDEAVGLESDIGRPLALHDEYRSWSDLADLAASPDPNLTGDSTIGRAPVIALHCQDDMTLNQSGKSLNLLDIIDGKADGDLAKVARGLATLQLPNNGGSYPVMLRYFWEFNVNAEDGGTQNGNNCYVPPGTVEPSPAMPDATAPPYNLQFIQAWQHIHDVLNRDATPQNITWVWNPNVVNLGDGYGDPTQPVTFDTFWPGQSYVDWIAADGYSLYVGGAPVSFQNVFGSFLQDISSNSQYDGKPIMIAETGSCNNYPYPYDQAGYIAAAESTLDTPSTLEWANVRGFIYFDAQTKYKWLGNSCDYSLDGQAQAPDPSGMAAFYTMANDRTFAPFAVSLPHG